MQKGVFHQGRILLVGDAAGLVRPMMGEGLSHAILSGQTAADEIASFLTAQAPDLSQYTHRVNGMIDTLRVSRLPIELFGFAMAARSALLKLVNLWQSPK